MKKDKKNIVFIAVGGSVALILVAMTIIVAFRMYPEYFGYPSDMFEVKNKKADSLAVEKIVNLSESKLKSIENEFKRVKTLEKEKNRLWKENKSLKDSLSTAQALIKETMDSLAKDKDVYSKTADKYNSILDSLNMSRNDQQISLKKIDQLNEQIKTIMAKNTSGNDSLKLNNFKTYAKMYNNSEPQEIAQILEKIDPSDASKILKLMQAKKAGKVIEAMDPKIAAAILLLGVE